MPKNQVTKGVRRLQCGFRMQDSTSKMQTGCGVRVALCILIALSAAACASSGNPRPRPFPGAPPPPESSSTAEPAPPVPVARSPIVETAMKLRGVPYRNGGSNPTGFDCSGFVQWVFAKNGVMLPREVREQYGTGQQIELRDVQPGDLVFFQTVSRGASHVGVVIGGDQFVHAPSSTGVVRVERFSATYWARRFVGARRVATDTTKTN